MEYSFGVVLDFCNIHSITDYSRVPFLADMTGRLKSRGITVEMVCKKISAENKSCIAGSEGKLIVSDYEEGFKGYESIREKSEAAFIYYGGGDGISKWVDGVDSCIDSFEGIDERYLNLLYCHATHRQAVIIENDRFVIREGRNEDSVPLYEIRSLDMVNDMMAEKCMDLESELEKRKSYYEVAYNIFGYGLWTIVDKSNKEIIGEIGLYNTSIGGESKVALGYYLKPSYWGHSYMKQMVADILIYAEEVIGVEEIYALVKHENYASVKTLRYNGFCYYGEERIEKEIYEVYRLPDDRL